MVQTIQTQVVDMPAVTQRQVPTFQLVRKTVEVPQIQYVDKIVDAPVAWGQQSVPRGGRDLHPLNRSTMSPSQPNNKVSASWLPGNGSPHSIATRRWTKHQILMHAARLPPRAWSLVLSSKGGKYKQVVDETDIQSPEHEMVQVAPNMGAGGSHPQATWNQEWAEELREIRRIVEFLVRRVRELDAKTDVAIRRLERLEKENFQLEDEALEASLPDALADKTKVVKLVVDKCFVDKGFGFGKAPSGEVVFIHASAVQGVEVLMIGTDAWVQVASDDARAREGGGTELAEPGGKPRGRRRETGRGQPERRRLPDDQRSSRQSLRPSPKELRPRCAPTFRACMTSQPQSTTARWWPLTTLPRQWRLSLVRPKLPRSKARSPDAPEAREPETSGTTGTSGLVASACIGSAALPGQERRGVGTLQKTRGREEFEKELGHNAMRGPPSPRTWPVAPSRSA